MTVLLKIFFVRILCHVFLSAARNAHIERKDQSDSSGDCFAGQKEFSVQMMQFSLLLLGREFVFYFDDYE